jgi:tetratricopeptide (TPR) repeat protein
MPTTIEKISLDPLVSEMASLPNEPARKEFLARHGDLVQGEVVEQLAPLVVEKLQTNARESLRLAEVVVLIARRLRSRGDLALALRAKANALYACGRNREAVKHHDQAYEIFTSSGNQKEAGRTLSNSIQPLILLGEYDRAFHGAERARKIFAELGETRRIATLENNLGNIFHRQDQFDRALAHYESAYTALVRFEQWEHAAAALSNMAICLVGLNDYPRALECYRKARELCVQCELPRMRDQADYNIAYLYYLRGEYNRAIDLLIATRRACESSGDLYHLALCHLDLSEIYLELNLAEEARQMARQAFAQFQKLGMGYEAAKSLTNEAISFGRQNCNAEALERFRIARKMFVREKNVVWPWLLDLYQALLRFHGASYAEARELCAGALEFFDRSPFPSKAALGHILLAQIALETGDLQSAEWEAAAAVGKLSNIQAPLLVYQAHLLLGQIAKRRNDRSGAFTESQKARIAFEALSTRLQGEELKISFVKNRMQVYDMLVELYLDGGGSEIPVEESFACIEAAKSRGMIEMMFQGGRGAALGEEGQGAPGQKVRDLREQLNWYYHRIELEQLRAGKISLGSIEHLQRQVQSLEDELLRCLRESPQTDRESVVLGSPAGFSLDRVQAALPAGAALVEFYSAADRIVAAVLTRESIELIPLTTLSQVAPTLHLLRFQFSKFRLGAAYWQQYEQPLLRATWSHLETLYKQLILPLRAHFHASHLVIVPHGPLHSLPFHALRNRDEYLGDSYTISYAPSAAIFALCQQKPSGEARSSLVLGIPDERAPLIRAEVESVAASLPNAQLFVGAEATLAVLREKGAAANLLHIATHGMYRQDNPMFSGIRLGDGYLNLYDLYQMRLEADLVTLSGCATGMNLVAAGDELLGLQRGLFCAGATSLLLSLWDVHDRSTAILMQEFYKNYMRTGNPAASLQAAMRTLRSENPHPYFWAPFLLVGKIAPPQNPN